MSIRQHNCWPFFREASFNHLPTLCRTLYSHFTCNEHRRSFYLLNIVPCILQHRYVAFLRHEARKITKTLYLCSTLKTTALNLPSFIPRCLFYFFRFSSCTFSSSSSSSCSTERIISFNYSSIFSSLHTAALI